MEFKPNSTIKEAFDRDKSAMKCKNLVKPMKKLKKNFINKKGKRAFLLKYIIHVSKDFMFKLREVT